MTRNVLFDAFEARAGKLPALRQALAFGFRRLGLAALLGFTCGAMAADLVLSEFMATATRTNLLVDEDGETSDWLEIHNPTTNPVNLAGWFLTDENDNLRKWPFPATNLNAGGYLVVFASGKDRRTPGARLHTNFKLSGTGEYLALVEPNGTNATTEYADFPPQVPDVSYGLGQSSSLTKLVSNASPARLLVPTDGSLGVYWTTLSMEDSSWLAVTNGTGFDLGMVDPGENPATLRHYYLFEGDNANDSAGTLAGVLVGAPAFAADRTGGRALSLNGASQYVDFSANDFSPVFSISLWIKPDYRSNILTLVANSTGGYATNGFRFFINEYGTQNGLLALENGNGSVGSLAKSYYPVDFDQWNHIVAIIDRTAGRVTFYKNGTNVSDPAFSAIRTDFQVTNVWNLGHMVNNAVFYYPGLMDEVSVWQGALSPSQIAGLAAGSPATNISVFRSLLNTDVQALMWNRNASAYLRLPFVAADPTKVQGLKLRMKYDDGFVAYLNGVEIVRRNAPGSGTVADSVTEFSGVQGQNHWYYGYYNQTADLDGIYQATNFTAFPTSANPYGADNYWTGTYWDWYAGNPPWTQLTADGGHPNGANNNAVHWAMRRWQSPVPGTLQLTLRLAKTDTGGGNGITGRVFHNGVEKWALTIAANNGTGITTNLIIGNVAVGDWIDLAMDPLGTDGQATDNNDSSVMTARIDLIPPPDLGWNSSALVARANLSAIQFEEFDLFNVIRWLVPGTNVLAIHGLNVHATNADFFLQAELESAAATPMQQAIRRYFAVPTPGGPNGVGTADLGPMITEPDFSPKVPEDHQDLVVTARLTPSFAPIVSNALVYRVMYGSEVRLPMFDDGAHGDGWAGDGIFGAIIPATAASPGQMVRWYVTASDSSNRVSRWPLYPDPNRSPQYLGTIVANPALTNPLPVLHWFIDPANLGAANTDAGTRCSLFFRGEFYDNAAVNIHGQSSRSFPKKSYDLEFNPGYKFTYDPNQPPVSDLNLMTTYPDKAHMRNLLAYETYRDAGAPYHWVFPARLQQNAAFFGDAHVMENGDDEYVERLGRDPDGALYKMYNTFTSSSHTTIGIGGSYAEKKTRKFEGNADLTALYNGVVGQSGAARTQYIYDNVDIPEMVNFLAARIITADRDCCHKNYYLYRDSLGNQEWQAFPWDVDLSFGRSWTNSMTYWDDTMTWFNGLFVGGNNGLFGALFNTPEIRQMYLRRLRTLMDELLQPPGTPANKLKYEKRIDALAQMLAPDAALDLAKWGTWGNGSSASSCCVQTLQQAVDIMKTGYLPPRRVALFTNLLVGMGGEIPTAQPLETRVSINYLEYNPASGLQAQEYIQLTNFNAYAVDLSRWRLAGAVQFVFQPGTVIPANGVLYVSPDVKAFRARTTGPRGGQGLFVQGNYQGQLSARGETVQLTDPYGRLIHSLASSNTQSLAQQYLRLTELMYNPSELAGNTNDAQAFEYVELKNLGPTALNLTGVRFTNGIMFNFSGSALTNLGPGQTVLVVKSLAAFTNRYPGVTNVAGQYEGALDNQGERLQLLDAQGEEVLDFSFDNAWYPATDGLGFSLVVINEQAEPDTWGAKTNWRASSLVGGSPGGADPPPQPIAPVVINEALTRTDAPPPTDTIELYNPTTNDVDLGGWYLSDDFATPRKYRIPTNTTIAAGGYLLFDESQFNPTPGTPPSFALGADGDEVYLFSANPQGDLTGYLHGFRFGAAENGVSFGRYVTSEGEEAFVAQALRTLGTNNAGPYVGPLVISEIMYHPPPINGTNDPPLSFIELANITSNAVPLYLVDTPTNTWRLRNAVDFDFPRHVVLAAGARLVVVGFDPDNDAPALTAFRSYYGLTTNTPVLGPYRGRLSNREDEVELKKPDLAGPEQVQYVMVEQVHYHDAAPWPVAADGAGASLQRLYLTGYANEPTNWIGALPTPGQALPLAGQPPTITAQPTGQTAAISNNFTMAVTATGPGPLRYQWQFNGTNLPGATNAALLLADTWLDRMGTYQVCVLSPFGSAASDPIPLTVVLSPAITAQPQSQTVFPGANITLRVVANSPLPIAYQWRRNNTNLPGATNTTLTLSNIQPADAGDYSVLISDAEATLLSATATIDVALHPLIQVPPQSQSVTPPNPVTLYVVATSGTLLRYQWRFNGVNIPGATNASLVLTNIQLADDGRYTVQLTDDYGAIESPPADLLVLMRPVIIQQPTPSNAVVLTGSDVRFDIGAIGRMPLSYRWRTNGTGTSYVTLYSTNCTLIITNVQLTNAGYFEVAITNIAGPAQGLSSRAYLTVMNPLTNQMVCLGESATFVFVVSNYYRANPPANLVLKYQWWFNATNFLTNATNATLTIANVQPEHFGAYTVVATNLIGTMASQTASLLLYDTNNHPPVLAGLSNRSLVLGQTLRLTVSASDPEAPPQILVFRLEDAPAGATINATNGLLVWTPATNQAPSTNRFLVRVSDDAALSLSATNSFIVWVALPPQLNPGQCLIASNQITLTIDTVPGLTCRLEYKDRLTDPTWTPLGPSQTTTTNRLSLTDTLPSRPQRFYRLAVE